MDMLEARRIARVLTRMGFPVIADNRGGWSGGPASMIWGVRPFNPNGFTGNYERFQDLPQAWKRALAADLMLGDAQGVETHHREVCQAPKPCAVCTQNENALTRAYHAWQEARAK